MQNHETQDGSSSDEPSSELLSRAPSSIRAAGDTAVVLGDRSAAIAETLLLSLPPSCAKGERPPPSNSIPSEVVASYR